MNTSKIELNITDEILARARQIAEDKDISLESVLLDGLALLFGSLPDIQITPDQLKTYSDEQLWAIVHQRLAWVQDTRLRELTEKGKQSILSVDEQNELHRLLDLVDHQMLLRSEALVLLKGRGHDIEKKLRLSM